MVILKSHLCHLYNEGDLNNLPVVKLAHECLLTGPDDAYLCIIHSSVSQWGKALLMEDKQCSPELK